MYIPINASPPEANVQISSKVTSQFCTWGSVVSFCDLILKSWNPAVKPLHFPNNEYHSYTYSISKECCQRRRQKLPPCVSSAPSVYTGTILTWVPVVQNSYWVPVYWLGTSYMVHHQWYPLYLVYLPYSAVCTL